ncbi:MAG: formate dehydrogenase subunit gamma [Planctomycetes bacterium]|nr:formate dehydrogenase subunit gamma [Planctomycetota bacterium]
MQPTADPGATPVPLTAAQRAAIDVAIAACRDLPGALLPLLHKLQEQLGYVPPASIPPIAKALGLSQADVHGVITFYHDFRTTPPGRHVVKLCRAEACQAMGCQRLEQHVQDRLGITFGQTSADGAVTLEAVYCLGNCALSPALLVDGRLQGRVSKERLDRVLDTCVHDGKEAQR